MRVRLITRIEDRHTLDRLSVSFWFVPLVMAVVAILLTWVLYWVDGRIPNEALEGSRFIVSGSVNELRGFLFAMATTCLATAGVVFTLLTLPLSTVAAQYGSRLLRIFLGDRITQFVLGMFVGTFVYCISGALVIPPFELQPESPQILATVGFLLFLASFASLVLLIQHITTMLQAPNIAAAAGAELMEVAHGDIPAEFGESLPRTACGDLPDSMTSTAGHPVRLAASGYIKSIDPKRILTLARERDLVIRLLHKPGHFISSGAVVAMVWPAERMDAASERQIQGVFNLGKQRTPTQDIEYAFNQLVEMGVRAMSPAINDPFTAMTCLDYIGDGLAVFARERQDWSYIFDSDCNLRIVFDPVTFDQVLDTAFGMLRHASANNAAVLLHMLGVIEGVGRETRSPEASRSLARHVSLIEAESRIGTLIEEDREAIGRRSESLKAKLSGSVP